MKRSKLESHIIEKVTGAFGPHLMRTYQAKEPWEMTLEEFAATQPSVIEVTSCHPALNGQVRKLSAEEVLWRNKYNHRSFIQGALIAGKPVQLEVVETYPEMWCNATEVVKRELPKKGIRKARVEREAAEVILRRQAEYAEQRTAKDKAHAEWLETQPRQVKVDDRKKAILKRLGCAMNGFNYQLREMDYALEEFLQSTKEQPSLEGNDTITLEAFYEIYASGARLDRFFNILDEERDDE